MMYGKTFQKLWRGSMRGEPNLQLVFIYMFCNCDEDGIFDAMPQEIIDATGLSAECVSEALAKLEAPDEDSRIPDNEGRRIIQLSPSRDWGWRIINHAKYRFEWSLEHRRELSAERQKRYREKKTSNSNALVTHSNASSVSVSVSASVSASVSDDEAFWQEMQKRYTWADVSRERVKMETWLMTRPGRRLTRRFVVNWLNKVEKPLTTPQPNPSTTVKY